MCLCPAVHNTFFLPRRQFAGCPTHVDKRVEISLQTLVRLPLQSGQNSELGPVEGFPLGVVHHPERRHSAVKICLLSTSPPENMMEEGKDDETSAASDSMWIYRFVSFEHYLLCHSRNKGSGSVATTEHLLSSSPSCHASGPPV